jgi:hypothetical protein
MRKILLLLIVCITNNLTAQQPVILEQIRCYSMNGPVMQYWQLPETRKLFVNSLNEALQKNYQAKLADTTLNIQFPRTVDEFNRIAARFSNADSTTLHLFIDLYEYTPLIYFARPGKMDMDSALAKRSKSVFVLGITLANHRQQVLLNESLSISISQSPGSGMGFQIWHLPITAKGFADMLQVGLNYSLNPDNENLLIEIKAPAAFYADDFIMPRIKGENRIITKTQKDIVGYERNGNQEMIRLGGAFYEEIVLRGKNRNLDPNTLLAKTIESTGNRISSDFVFLRQESRDVLRDRNYSIRLVTELNPYNYDGIRKQSDLYTRFLTGPVHTLLENTDTIARFMIRKNVEATGKNIYPYLVYNGWDSTSMVTIGNRIPPEPVRYEYQVEGTMLGKDFRIQHGDNNYLKEIYLDGVLVSIATGKFLPERFVVFDASLSPEMLNRLLVLAFNRFFE